MNTKRIYLFVVLVLLVLSVLALTGCNTTGIPKHILDETVVTYRVDPLTGQTLRDSSYTGKEVGGTIVCTERKQGYWVFDGCVTYLDPVQFPPTPTR